MFKLNNMCKKLLAILLAAVFALPAFAQTDTKKTYKGRLEVYENLVKDNKGGVEGTVVNRSGRVLVADAMLTLYRGETVVLKGYSDTDGYFLFENLPQGNRVVLCLSTFPTNNLDRMSNNIIESILLFLNLVIL